MGLPGDNFPTLPVNAAALQGKSVSATAPTNAQLLAYNSATGQWEPTTDVGAALPDPVTVPHGGTGLATLTAHALQVGAGVGTPTQVGPDASTTKALFSAGAAADPAFRAIAAGDLPNTAVTAASYGSASSIPSLTVDAQGRLTAAASNTPALPASAITSGTLAVAQGGTNAATAAAARSSLGAAASGANGDITSLTNMTGTITKLSNIATEGSGVTPIRKVGADVASTGAGAQNTQIVTYTPSANGLFLIVVYASATTADVVTATVTFTDVNDNTAQTKTVLNGVGTGANGTTANIAVAYAKAGTAISAQITISAFATTLFTGVVVQYF